MSNSINIMIIICTNCIYNLLVFLMGSKNVPIMTKMSGFTILILTMWVRQEHTHTHTHTH